MCYAIPAKILDISGDNATVDYGGVEKAVNLHFVENVALGDYVLIHAGFAIEKLEKRSALESLKLINEMLSGSKGSEVGQ